MAHHEYHAQFFLPFLCFSLDRSEKLVKCERKIWVKFTPVCCITITKNYLFVYQFFKTRRRFQQCKMYTFSFDKFYMNVVYCIQKSSNDHFHPQLAIIVLRRKISSFSVVQNKETRPRFLVLAVFIAFIALRDHVTSLVSRPSLSECKDGRYRE